MYRTKKYLLTTGILITITLLMVSCSLQKKSVYGLEEYKGVLGLKTLRKQSWFKDEYNRYKMNDTLQRIAENLSKHKIIVFGGGWCSDTRRELPRFIKILDQLNYPMQNLEIIFLDRDKKCERCKLINTPNNHNVKFVPTFIIIDASGKEKGRIVENPSLTLEKDLENIVN